MKIISLNVNRLSGMEERDYTDSFASLDKCPKANELIAFVKGFLYGEPDGVVFLYEIPFCKCNRERRLYQNFRNRFPEEQYRISAPGRKGQSCTLAICNKACGWTPKNNIFGKETGYTNKYLELVNENFGLHLMGIHAPVESNYNKPEDIQKFFDAMRKYAEEYKDESLIILGDMNVHSEKPCSYFTTFDTIRKSVTDGGLRYCDKIADGEITHFPTGHTLDHVLVSPALQDKATVTARVISRAELELSDHAVIIVDIEE